MAGARTQHSAGEPPAALADRESELAATETPSAHQPPDEPSRVPSEVAARRSTRERLVALAPLAVLWAGFGIAFASLVSQARQLWFFGDEWDFLASRDLSSNTWDRLMTPHNEHWSTLPIVVYRSLYAMVGVRHYQPYGLLPILLHLGVCMTIYVLLRRHGLSRWQCVAPTLIMAFLGGGAEDTLWAFQIGFIGSVLFGLLAIHQLSRASRRGPIALAALFALLSLMCSGVGITMVAAATLYALLRRGWRQAVMFAAGPTAIFACWYLAYGRTGTKTVDPEWEIVPQFVANGLTHLWEPALSVPGTGVVVLALMIIAVLCARPARYSRMHTLAFAGLMGALMQFTVSAAGRATEATLDQALASRYLYIGCALTIPALALGLSMLGDRAAYRPYAFPAIIAVITAMIAVNGMHLNVEFREGRNGLDPGRADRIKGAAQLVRDGALILFPLPDPELDPNINAEYLERPSTLRAFPSGASEQGILDAAGRMQVLVSPNPLPPSIPAASAIDVSGLAAESTDGVCTTYAVSSPTAWIRLAPSPDGASITLTGGFPRIRTQLERDAHVSTYTVVSAVPFPEPSTLHAGTSARDATLIIELTNAASPVVICLSST